MKPGVDILIQQIAEALGEAGVQAPAVRVITEAKAGQ